MILGRQAVADVVVVVGIPVPVALQSQFPHVSLVAVVHRGDAVTLVPCPETELVTGVGTALGIVQDVFCPEFFGEFVLV